MAAPRGRKPKAPALHLVEGTRNTTKHGSEDKVRDAAASSELTPLVKPENLLAKIDDIWDQHISPCTWLDAHMEPSAFAWCCLYEEFTDSPRHMVAGRIAQMRALASELGLTDPRQRGTAVGKPEKEDPAEKYLSR